MKGLLGLLILVCLERRALAQDCNDMDCNPGCFVAQEHDLTLAIAKRGTCLVNSSIINSHWRVNLKASFTTREGQDRSFFCGIMEQSCFIPFDISFDVPCIDIQLECNLKGIHSTVCDMNRVLRPVSILELIVRCSSIQHTPYYCRVSVNDSQRTETLSETRTGAPSMLPNCETTSVTPSRTRATNNIVNQTQSRHRETNQATSETPSETPSGTDKEGEGSRSSTATIVASVFGCLIVLILVALLALQLIRIFRKRKYHQHTINGRTENSDTTSQNMYAHGSPLPGEPAPYECAVVNGSGAKDLPLHQQQPSPYETATVANGVYSLLEPPDEIQSRGQPGGNRTDTTDDQHIYEDADRYVSSPECGIVNADYEVSLKSARDPNKSPPPATDGGDYADPDDALFDDEEYETRPKTIKSAGGGNDRAPISTQYQPSDENDYSVPSDAIIEETDNQESDDEILNPLYHELGKNVNQVKPNNDPSTTGVPKGKAATVESTMYEPAVSAPRPSTAHSDMEPITTSHVVIETTSSHQGTQDNTLSDREAKDSTPQSTVDQHKPTDPET